MRTTRGKSNVGGPTIINMRGINSCGMMDEADDGGDWQRPPKLLASDVTPHLRWEQQPHDSRPEPPDPTCLPPSGKYPHGHFTESNIPSNEPKGIPQSPSAPPRRRRRRHPGMGRNRALHLGQRGEEAGLRAESAG